MAKEWFYWSAATPLEPGTTLHFHIDSVTRFKDKSSFSAVQATGSVFVKDYKDDLIKVGEIDYEADSVSYGNPVVEYVKRAGGSSQAPIPVENGYSLVKPDASAKFVAPSTNEPYSNISGDFNPIHINPYFADFAALPGTITHGLFSSAATRKYVEDVAAEGHPERCLSFEANFTGMVIPGDELEVKLRHIAMHEGNKVVRVETFNQRGEKVLEGQAEIAQPPTVYVFTGQGSQEQGMGQDLYNSSETAKALWDEADNHLRSTMGFSILEIVNQNPLTKTVHFGGVRGHAIRDRYMSMAYEAMDENGNVTTLPLFPEITRQSQSYTFHSPKGLLFATQFAQIALVLVELSAFQDMKQRGLIKSDAAFAGHSLGEYASLAAVAAVLQVKDLVDVVFYRGLTMQRAVQRDAQGRSNYGMMACNPTRIGPSFSDAAFEEVVDTIGRISGRLIQTVNYNVSGQQMVIAGELITLMTMTNVLNYIKVQKLDLKKLQEIMSLEEVREKLELIVTEIYSQAQEVAKKGDIQLERGFATIPLPGIDVPFHSRYLTGGVAPFRSYLMKRINVESIRPNLLVDRYIPNLIAKPFELTKEYAEVIFNQTDSARLEKVIKNWERDGWGSPERQQRLTTTLVVELLAYQFARCVNLSTIFSKLVLTFSYFAVLSSGSRPRSFCSASLTASNAWLNSVQAQRWSAWHSAPTRHSTRLRTRLGENNAPCSAPVRTRRRSTTPLPMSMQTKCLLQQRHRLLPLREPLRLRPLRPLLLHQRRRADRRCKCPTSRSRQPRRCVPSFRRSSRSRSAKSQAPRRSRTWSVANRQCRTRLCRA